MIHTENIEFANEGGRVFSGYLARPEASGGKPAIMILSEMFGLNEPMRLLAREYAERGYAAIVPNVYWRCDQPGAMAYEGEERQIAQDRIDHYDYSPIGPDLQKVLDYLRGQPWNSHKVMALGFCAGGNMAYLAAARTDIDGAVSFYGLGISSYLDEQDKVRCPVQLHYGMLDMYVPAEEIRKVGAGVAGHSSIQYIEYPDAGHSFCNPVRPGYHAPSATLADQRVQALLDRLG